MELPSAMHTPENRRRTSNLFWPNQQAADHHMNDSAMIAQAVPAISHQLCPGFKALA
jgi:hypothetical protein